MTYSYTVTPRNLTISQGDNHCYWKICCDPCTRSEIAKLVKACSFDVQAHVAAGYLRNKTSYSVYLVFKLDCQSYGLEKATASVRFLDDEAPGMDDKGRTVFIGKQRACGEYGRFPVERYDGWMELKLGNFINNHGPCSRAEMRIFETSGSEKSGIMIKGIELRPHH